MIGTLRSLVWEEKKKTKEENEENSPWCSNHFSLLFAGEDVSRGMQKLETKALNNT